MEQHELARIIYEPIRKRQMEILKTFGRACHPLFNANKEKLEAFASKRAREQAVAEFQDGLLELMRNVNNQDHG